MKIKSILPETDSSVLSYSKGEVKNFSKYNERSKILKGEPDGLFCEKIFGPLRDYTCSCGIIKRLEKPEKCPECGVEWISSLERRNRFGHIELNTYVIPPLTIPVLSAIWGIKKKVLQAFIYRTKDSPNLKFVESQFGTFISRNGSRYDLEVFEDGFDNVWSLMKKAKELDIDPEISMMERNNLTAQIYFSKGFNFFSFVLSKILVTPPNTRDRRKLGDSVLYHPDNMIYSRIIRNALRIKVFKEEIQDPAELDFLISNETKLIQKLYQSMLVKGYKSSSSIEIQGKLENLKGKGGMFRGDILGKRIDFSGRSAITSGPFLKVDQMGVPYPMLLELFYPDLIREISRKYEEEGISKVRAFRLAKQEGKILSEKTIKLIEYLAKDYGYWILMNRAPSLHRYSVIAFDIVPVWSKAIHFPPSACPPFNADFDGDSMAIFLIHSSKARKEMFELVHYNKNFMSSANFDTPNAKPSHEQVVGSYLLTRGYERDNWISKPVKSYYRDWKQIKQDWEMGYLSLEDKIVFINSSERYTLTAGAGIIFGISGIKVDYVLGKAGITKLVSEICYSYSPKIQSEVLSSLQDLYFEVATKSGLSVCSDDCKRPEDFTDILMKTKEEATKMQGMERAKLWDECFETLVSRWFKETDSENPFKIMGKSGARVTDVQVKAMIVGKGLQANMDGSLNPDGIYESLYQGLSPLVYFNTCGPARKGFTQNAMIVPASGYLTRQLVRALEDLSITTDDCGSTEGILSETKNSLYRYTIEGKLITEENLHEFPEYVELRSPTTCQHVDGLCRKCCGKNPSNKKDWNYGFGIGVACAQTYCEKSSQVAMQGKHCQMSSDTFYDINFNEIRFKDAKKAIDLGHKIYVHSMNSEGKFEVKRIIGVDCERFDDKYVKVTFDNGKVIRCTVDHPLIVRSGELVEAQNLQPGQSMMPYYFNKSDGEKTYNMVRNNDEDKSWSVGYHLSSEHYDSKSICPDGEILSRHHKDFTKTNDYPTNILGCSNGQHIKFHVERLWYEQNILKIRNNIGFGLDKEVMQKIAEHNREPWRRELSGRVISEWLRNNPEIKSKNGRYGRDIQNQMYIENPELLKDIFDRIEGTKCKKDFDEYVNKKKFNVRYDSLGIGHYTLRSIYDLFPEWFISDYPWNFEFFEEDLLSKQEKQNLAFYDKYLKIIYERNMPVAFESLVEVENGFPKNYKPSKHIDWISKYRDTSILGGEWSTELPFDFYWTRSQKQAFSRFKNVFLELHKLGWACTKEKYEEMFLHLYKTPKVAYSKYESCLEALPENYMSYIFPQGDESDPMNNHKVVSVEIVHLDRMIPFYGLEVEGEWHNYPTGAGVMSHNTSGSLSLKTYGKQVSNFLANLIRYLGGRSTMGVPLNLATVENGILDVNKLPTYQERVLKFLDEIKEIFEDKDNKKFASIWCEVLARGLSNIVYDTDGKTPLGYRHKGYPCRDIKFNTLHKTNTSQPSWMKGLAFGYVSQVIERAMLNNETTHDLIIERIIQGDNIFESKESKFS